MVRPDGEMDERNGMDGMGGIWGVEGLEVLAKASWSE
jgi:hypothetical protein